jgi:tetratricopeptide (TPR) repeat protein
MDEERTQPVSTSVDPLADEVKRRKLKEELARLGMTPDELRRLLAADAPEKSPEPTMAMPAPPSAASRPERVTAESLQGFAAQLLSGTASAKAAEFKQIDLKLPEFRESSAQEKRQAETLLREAFVLRKKEQFPEAIAKCEAAIALVPQDAAALEMLGDLFQGVARVPAALAAYKRATEADPKRFSAERKYADLLMRQQNWNAGSDPEAVPKNPWVSVFLSLLFPGAGQVYNGQVVKGAAIFVLALLCIYGYTFFRAPEVVAPPGGARLPERGAPVRRKEPVRYGGMIPIVAGGIVYLFALIDANKVAQRLKREKA